jgi:hypothetical protein
VREKVGQGEIKGFSTAPKLGGKRILRLVGFLHLLKH